MNKLESKRETLISQILNNCYVDSWQCFGAGEIGAEVRSLGGDRFLFELKGDNGMNTLYNPSGEPWTEQSQSAGQSGYTLIWDTDFNSFKKEVRAWAGKRVKLFLSEEESI